VALEPPAAQAPARFDAQRWLTVVLTAVVGVSSLLGLAWYAGRDATPAWARLVEEEGDHLDVRELADALIAAPERVLLVDVRPEDEFAQWHLPGAVNLSLPVLLGPKGAAVLRAAEGKRIVLLSNGMVHPAQAWVELTRRGYRDVFVLEGGLTDFKREALTPPSLRGPVSRERAEAERQRFVALQAWLTGAR
jgi:rhodanese-related sulfurtransferase